MSSLRTMASRGQTDQARPGDLLLAIPRSADELSLARGDRIELIERDDEFGDGWFLGKHLKNDETGLFPEVYTTMAPKPTLSTAMKRPTQQPAQSAAHVANTGAADDGSVSQSTLSNDSLGSVRQSSVGTASLARSSDGTSYTPTLSLDSKALPATPPTGASAGARRTSPSARSLSLGSTIHETSPVMNETLSVIEEHIVDMHTPRSSLLMVEERSEDDVSEFGGRLQDRLSYINGHETDEEEGSLFTEAEVKTWTPDQVAQLLEDRGADKYQCQVFRDEEITGEVLLHMDQSSLMLKQFDLGKMGRRLALWHKIHDFQLEVRGPKRASQSKQAYATAARSIIQANRARSPSGGAMLPRIPSLMESPRHGSRSSLSQEQLVMDSGVILRNESPTPQHSPRPSAASIRSLNHNRRHSSIDSLTTSQSQAGAARHSQVLPKSAGHTKHGSFDHTWTMGSSFAAAEDNSQTPAAPQSPIDDSKLQPPSTSEIGMTVVSSLDLDRGYFSGNEVDNRRSKNLLRKRESPTHTRAPSDSFGTKRLSSVFRQRRSGSTDSVDDGITLPSVSASHNYYSAKMGPRATSSPHFKTIRPASPASPVVTKLEYSDAPSIDAIASSPNFPGSETSSIERSAVSTTNHSRSAKSNRASGLRATSDAVTTDEKSLAQSLQDRIPESVMESPKQPPSQGGSSTPSINSKSIDLDETSLLKSSTYSAGSRPPLAPRRKTKKNTSAYTRGLEKKSPKEQMMGCDYSGWMKKKSSNLMTTWKTRLFVLRGRRLSYYYSEDDTEEKGLIDISFHRVLPANNDRIVGLHATVTGATSSPTSPQHAQMPTAASTDAAKADEEGKDSNKPKPKPDTSGMFIFKLVPPRSGLSKAVNFTKPTVHYFAVDNLQQGRLWMAALMKATIDRDETKEVITTYNQKTISLVKAKAMRQRPPALMELDDDDQNSIGKASVGAESQNEKSGLNIKFSDMAVNGDSAEKDSISTANSLAVPRTRSVGGSSDYLDETADAS